MDEGEAARDLARLVGLKVADEVPFPARHRLHLRRRLVHPVLAQDVRPASSAARQVSGPKPLVTATIDDLVGVANARAIFSRTPRRRSWADRSSQGDDRAEPGAVRQAAMGGKEVALLGAHARCRAQP